MSETISRSPDELLEDILDSAWGVPVREMEAVLAHGDGAVEAVLTGLRRAREREEEGLEPLWPVVLLGELRSPEGTAALAEVIFDAGLDEVVVPQAAAEALAKIGPPALPALRSLLEAEGTAPRIWAYAAAGWIREEETHALLVNALSEDREMADVVASALADQGREEAIPLLVDALRHVDPWQRPDLEEAIRTLDRTGRERLALERDWRLRYRPDPGLGVPSLTWAAISALAREAAVESRRSEVPVRSVEEILSEPDETEAAERCESCGEPMIPETGVPVCPETAVEVALVQHRMLDEWGEELATEDLFDVLDGIEEEIWLLDRAGAAARSRRKLRHRDDEITGLFVLREGCVWLVERGVESVSGGRAALLATTGRLADRYGDPEGLLAPVGADPAFSDVGRNDPCPCGSGAKYKRCCGDLSRLASGERRDAGKRGWGAQNGRDAALPPEMEREVLHRFLDRHYRAWPDEPVPALGGRTPREAAEDPSGREHVAALLHSFERMEGRKQPSERYEFDWLWGELDIEDLR